jgi:hypothetical protein
MHRELKTHAIFFDEEHQVNVGGFGPSNFDDWESLQQTTFSKSSSLSQAPELWTSDYDGSVDVYAFAMILFRVAMGHSPFPGLCRKTEFARMNHGFACWLAHRSFPSRVLVRSPKQRNQSMESQCWADARKSHGEGMASLPFNGLRGRERERGADRATRSFNIHRARVET